MNKNLTRIIGFRVSEEFKFKLRTISEARGEDVSDFVRRAILKEFATLGFLPSSQKKALGVAR